VRCSVSLRVPAGPLTLRSSQSIQEYHGSASASAPGGFLASTRVRSRIAQAAGLIAIAVSRTPCAPRKAVAHILADISADSHFPANAAVSRRASPSDMLSPARFEIHPPG